MKILEKIKSEPRMDFAIINFISFFLPWLAINASASTEIMGETSSADMSTSVTGFGIVDYSIIGILFYLIPVIMFLIPIAVKQTDIIKYFFLILPIISLLLMFMVGAFINGAASVNYTSDMFDVTTKVGKLIGYWIALICNIGVIVFTLMKDFNIKSGEDLKKNVQNIDVGNLTSQVSHMAKDLGSSVQKSIYVDCPNCGNKIMKGKTFCSKCGTKIDMETKEAETTSTNNENLKCSNCGSIVVKGSKFCQNCGEVISEKSKEKKCIACGTILENESKFCPQCGQKVEGE